MLWGVCSIKESKYNAFGVKWDSNISFSDDVDIILVLGDYDKPRLLNHFNKKLPSFTVASCVFHASLCFSDLLWPSLTFSVTIFFVIPISRLYFLVPWFLLCPSLQLTLYVLVYSRSVFRWAWVSLWDLDAWLDITNTFIVISSFRVSVIVSLIPFHSVMISLLRMVWYPSLLFSSVYKRYRLVVRLQFVIDLIHPACPLSSLRVCKSKDTSSPLGEGTTHKLRPLLLLIPSTRLSGSSRNLCFLSVSHI